MADHLQAGALVVIENLQGTQIDGEQKDLNGRCVQLYEYHAGTQRWLAVTLDGQILALSPKNLRLAKVGDLSRHDVIVGPASRPDVIRSAASQCLKDKGFVHMKVVTSAEDLDRLVNISRTMLADGFFTCLPPNFTPGYLGKDSAALTFFLESEEEERLGCDTYSALCKEDNQFLAIWRMIAETVEMDLGIIARSRSHMILRRPLQGDEAERGCAAARESGNRECDNFLSFMTRKRVGLLKFVGPAPGVVQLIPREDGEDDITEPFDVVMEPGNVLIFMCERYDFSCKGEGECVVLQQWFLEDIPEYQLTGDLIGNVDVFGTVAEGPMISAGEKICCVGMGHRNPGKSDSFDFYWSCTRNGGGDGMLEIPKTRWDIDIYCDWFDRDRATQQGKSYSRHQGHLEGIEMFDAYFFQISPAEALGMDVEQRLTLETGWMALQDAGFDKVKMVRESKHIGVWCGISGSDWTWVPLPPGAIGGMGGNEAIIAGRFTFCMNLKGPAMTINTACSASLVTTHQCKLQLLFKPDKLECGLATGISINTTPHVFIGNCQSGALTFMGRSFSFDASADGFGRSEGTAATLYRLEGYSRECYGILAGSQANHDGRSASLTAPNGPAQERCIRSVIQETMVEPPEIDCFECHGTGTSLGDPIEVGAFKRLYNRKKRYTPVLATTSKTNLGHTEGGAGIAGFIKCMQMCMHTECCPNIHLKERNPHLDVDGFPVQFVSEGTTMCADSAYAGVSSFGVSGTNGHCLAYGKNIATSRGTGQKNMMSLMMKKITSTPGAIVQTGSTWEDWASMGRPYTPQPGSVYQVELATNGDVSWREVVQPDLRLAGGPFCLQGSFTKWALQEMTPDPNVSGLHTTEVEIGESGEETFQVVYDFDTDKVLYPGEKLCRRKSAKIIGPLPAPSTEDAWLLVGQPGTLFRVEVYLNGPALFVSWLQSR